jgi:hypothetical protein
MKTTHPYIITQTERYHHEVLKEPIMNVVGIRFILVNADDLLFTVSDFIWVNSSLASRFNSRSSPAVVNGMKQNVVWLQPFPIPERQNQIKTEYWEVANNKSVPIYDFDLEFRSEAGVFGQEGDNAIRANWLILFDTVD